MSLIKRLYEEIQEKEIDKYIEELRCKIIQDINQEQQVKWKKRKLSGN